MAGFFEKIKRVSTASLKTTGEAFGRQLKDLVDAPVQKAKLEQDLSRMSRKVESLEERLERETRERALLAARTALLGCLQRRMVARAIHEKEEATSGLRTSVSKLGQDLELLQTLHGKAEQQLEERRSELASATEALGRAEAEAERSREELEALRNETVSQIEEMTVAREERERLLSEIQNEAEASARKVSRIQQELEETRRRIGELDDQKADAETAYRSLMGDVKRAVRQLLAKLIEQGMSSESIVALVPDLDPIYPKNKILDLEHEIRSHNSEVEALLAMQELRAAPTGGDEHEASAPRLSPPDFFEAIFEP